MKKELREEIKKDQADSQKGKLSKMIDENKGVVKALGIASFLALAGYSAAQLLKDEKLMKKIQDGLKNPKGLKYIEKFFKDSGALISSAVSGAVVKGNTKEKAKTEKPKNSEKQATSAVNQDASIKKQGIPSDKKSGSKSEAMPEAQASSKFEAKEPIKAQTKAAPSKSEPKAAKAAKPETKSPTGKANSKGDAKEAKPAKKAEGKQAPKTEAKTAAKGGTKTSGKTKSKKSE